MAYVITQNYTRYNRSHEALSASGMVVHETATPGATDENERAYFNTGYRAANANAFIDWDSITETVPDNEVAWGSGYTSNHRFLQVELCRPSVHDEAKFTEVWNRAIWYFAYKFVNKLHITTVTKDNLVSHAEVSAKWHETNHTDPVEYFNEYGKSVDVFRSEVQAMINSMIAPKPAAPVTPKTGTVTASVLNVRSTPEVKPNNKLGTLKKGTVVRIDKKVGDWYSIFYGEHGGYVSSQYIK